MYICGPCKRSKNMKWKTVNQTWSIKKYTAGTLWIYIKPEQISVLCCISMHCIVFFSIRDDLNLNELNIFDTKVRYRWINITSPLLGAAESKEAVWALVLARAYMTELSTYAWRCNPRQTMGRLLIYLMPYFLSDIRLLSLNLSQLKPHQEVCYRWDMLASLTNQDF